MIKKISILVFLSIILFFFSCSKEQQVANKRQNDDSSRFIKIFQTAKGTNDRLSEKPSLEFDEIPSERFNDNRLPSIVLDANKKFQTILGFGGAFTEASAVTFYKLSPQKRQKIIEVYFDPDVGHGYTFCRTHINSCDFSLGNYAYVEVADDTNLTTFSIERDEQHLIPFIKEAQ
ncbi:MAG: hypothetical protein KAV45_09535, partial [Calditrichia bacterium]|nr:hypothetical protein [Calditrichia bacterium]